MQLVRSCTNFHFIHTGISYLGASARTNEDISDGAIFALIVGLPIGIMLLLIIAYNVRKKMKEGK